MQAPDTTAQSRRPEEVVRRTRRGDRRLARSGGRRGAGPAGAEWRRQVDHHRHGLRPDPTRRRPRAGGRHGAGAGRSRLQAPHRPRAAGPGAVRRPAGAGECRAVRRPVRPAPGPRQAPRHRGAGRRRAGRPRTRQAGHLQRRHEAPAEHCLRAGARPRGAAARRADGRRRPAKPQRHLRHPAGAEGCGQGARLHHALHGRGRAPGRPRGHHRPRPRRGPGHAARAVPHAADGAEADTRHRWRACTGLAAGPAWRSHRHAGERPLDVGAGRPGAGHRGCAAGAGRSRAWRCGTSIPTAPTSKTSSWPSPAANCATERRSPLP